MLALQTTTEQLTVALRTPEGVLERTEPRPRKTLVRLVPLIQELLSEAGLQLAELPAVAVCTGPGSFTGIRIGLATAKALVLPLELPCYGLSSLLAAAYSAGEAPEGEYFSVRPAFAKEFYFARVERLPGGWQIISQPKGATLEELADLLRSLPAQGVLAPAVPAMQPLLDVLQDEIAFIHLPGEAPKASHVLEAVEAVLEAKVPAPNDFASPAPLYLYRSQAERALQLEVD